MKSNPVYREQATLPQVAQPHAKHTVSSSSGNCRVNLRQPLQNPQPQAALPACRAWLQLVSLSLASWLRLPSPYK